MSRPLVDTKSVNAQSVPLVARLLQSTEAQSASGGTQPTVSCWDQPCTKKYPSDGDEMTSPTWDR